MAQGMGSAVIESDALISISDKTVYRIGAYGGGVMKILNLRN